MWHRVWWCDTVYDDVTLCMMMWHCVWWCDTVYTCGSHEYQYLRTFSKVLYIVSLCRKYTEALIFENVGPRLANAMGTIVSYWYYCNLNTPPKPKCYCNLNTPPKPQQLLTKTIGTNVIETPHLNLNINLNLNKVGEHNGYYCNLCSTYASGKRWICGGGFLARV